MRIARQPSNEIPGIGTACPLADCVEVTLPTVQLISTVSAGLVDPIIWQLTMVCFIGHLDVEIRRTLLMLDDGRAIVSLVGCEAMGVVVDNCRSVSLVGRSCCHPPLLIPVFSFPVTARFGVDVVNASLVVA